MFLAGFPNTTPIPLSIAETVPGYSEIAFQIVPSQGHALEDWGKIRRAFR
jgi:hypothetical protein